MRNGLSFLQSTSQKGAFYHGKNGAHQMGDVYMVGATHGGGGHGTDGTPSGDGEGGEGGEGGTVSSASSVTAVLVCACAAFVAALF